MKKTMLKILFFFIFILILFYPNKPKTNKTEKLNYVNYEELKDTLQNKDSFILYIGRPSCKICAIVSNSLHKFIDNKLPIYILDMEPYRDTDQYETIKKELNFYFMPNFKYYEYGEQLYHMNSPLDDSYFSESAPRMDLKESMEIKIQQFIDGAAGTGQVINEPVKTPQINGEKVES